MASEPDRARSQWIVAVAGVALLSAGWIAGCGESSAARSAIHAATPTDPPTEVPIVACPTTHGDSTTYPARFPRLIATPLEAATAARLAYYTDDQRDVAPILAPRGWQCHVFDYVDGGVRIAVSPRGAPPESFVAVVAEADHACVGCDWELICTLLPDAASKLGYNPYNCPAKAAGERVSWVRGSATDNKDVDDVVSFVDPPGVRGTGTPSGGVVTARGLLMYRAHPGDGRFAAIETCALGVVDRTLCDVILDDFEQRGWGLS